MIVLEDGAYAVQGPVTLDTVQSVLDEGERLFTGAEILVDLSGVTETDSSAVSLLLEWSRRAAARGQQIAFRRMGSSLRTLAELYGVAALIPEAAGH